MKIDEALKELGVTADLLSPAEKEALDRDGYLMIHNVLSKDKIAAILRRFDLLAELEGENAGKEVHQEAGTARLANLVDKGEIFHDVFTHPKVVAAAAHILNGDIKLSSLNSRSALPGQGAQALHGDWPEPAQPGAYQGCNTLWMLCDFNKQNGATRIVPGSHRASQTPQQTMPDPIADHPEQLVVDEPAGTVLVFNAHTWHGGTLNRTDKPRPVMAAFYSRRHQPQQTNQREFLSPATIKSFSPAVQCLLDVEKNAEL